MNISKETMDAAVEASAKHIARDFCWAKGYSLDDALSHIETKWTRYVDEARGIISAALPSLTAELRRDADCFRILRNPARVYWIRVQSQPHGDVVYSGQPDSTFVAAISAMAGGGQSPREEREGR